MGVDVVEERAAGVAHVGDVRLAAREFPRQPGVDGAEGEPSFRRRLPRAVHMIENPLELRAGEIGVEDETGLLLNHRRMAQLLQRVAMLRRAAVLPHDGAVDGPAGRAIPHHGRLALVGDADGGDLVELNSSMSHGLGDHARLGGPDFLGVVLHPAGLRIKLCELPLRDCADGPGVIKEDGA